MILLNKPNKPKQEVFFVYKKIGETPLECLNRVRSDLFLDDEPVTYAGRLDPMAEGVLVLLSGETRLDKKRYTSLPKKYTFDCLWGPSTDSFDVLGIPKFPSLKCDISDENVLDFCKKFKGSIKQYDPLYSSRYIKKNVRPSLETERTLTRNVQIMSLEPVFHFSEKPENLFKIIEDKVSRVSGDFRQKEILKAWKELFDSSLFDEFKITRFELVAGHGTFVRSVVEDLVSQLGCDATTLHIWREKVGNFTIYNCTE